jgi:23S rRNA (cytidine2498-2'-O)-methyltransferase
MSKVPAVLALCRAGFEPECAAELEQWAESGGYARFEKNAGLVVWVGAPRERHWPRTQETVFARQLIPLLSSKPLALDSHHRIDGLLEALQGRQYSALYLDHADTNESRSLTRLFQRLQPPLLSAAGKAGLLDRSAAKRAHLVFADGETVWLGESLPGQTLKSPMGIPRLKMPHDAPSRSVLKLAEAFEFFMDREEQAEWLREGLTAVDLGACPGGWTWQLVQHGLQVTAIDNGAMDSRLMATGQVEHVQADGFVWRPSRPVHWLVCDMVEQPARVAALVADWLADGDAQRAMFNLKLPMKKRLDELEYCQHLIESRLQEAGKKIRRLAFRQLYHDREEVTGFLVI